MLWDMVKTTSPGIVETREPIESESSEPASAEGLFLLALGYKIVPHLCRSASCRIRHGAIVDRGEPDGVHGDDEPTDDDYSGPRGSEAAGELRESQHAIMRDLKR